MDEQEALKMILPAPLLFHLYGLCGNWRSACEVLLMPRVANTSTVMDVPIMLVLSRKVGEKVIIDGCITVTILAVDGNKIRLGITARPEVCIDREEVHRRRMEFAEIEVNPEELVRV